MPTKREREYYAMGFRDGEASHRMRARGRPVSSMEGFDIIPSAVRPSDAIAFGLGMESEYAFRETQRKPRRRRTRRSKPRTLSKWQKFVKTNSKKKEFRFRSGKVNLKKLGVAYRKKHGKRKR